MDFFGTGWDVAERMGLLDALARRALPDRRARIRRRRRRALRAHADRARARARSTTNTSICAGRTSSASSPSARARLGIAVRYGTSLAALIDTRRRRQCALRRRQRGRSSRWSSAPTACIRACANLFSAPKRQFARFLGLYVAGFPRRQRRLSGARRRVKLYEEPDRVAFLYPLDAARMDATYVFRHAEMDTHAAWRAAGDLARRYRGAGWIAAGCVARACRRRSGLLRQRDADRHAAMAQGPRRADRRRLRLPHAARRPGLAHGDGRRLCAGARSLRAKPTTRAAFAAYQDFLKPHVDRKQRDAARFAGLFVPKRATRAPGCGG